MDPQGTGLENRLYLGDGAYVGISQQNAVVLWTTDGLRVTNVVVLEWEAFEKLLSWAREQ